LGGKGAKKKRDGGKGGGVLPTGGCCSEKGKTGRVGEGKRTSQSEEEKRGGKKRGEAKGGKVNTRRKKGKKKRINENKESHSERLAWKEEKSETTWTGAGSPREGKEREGGAGKSGAKC